MLTRRQFLTHAAGGVAALGLAACSPYWQRRRPDMDNAQTGTVVAIDRANGVVRGVLGTGEEITAPFFRDWARMPWPLAQAVFRQDRGTWLCLGPIGARRRVFRDDFTRVGAATFYGDTPWTLAAGTAAAATTGIGAVRITSANAGLVSTNGRLVKDASLSLGSAAGTAFWLSGSAAPQDADAAPFIGWNINSDIIAGENIQLVGGPGAIGLGLACQDSTSDQIQIPTSPFVVGQFNTYDLLFAEGQWVAGWVDGDGPYSITTGTSVPNLGPLIPGIGVLAPALTTLRVDWDWVQSSIVTTFADPSLFTPPT